MKHGELAGTAVAVREQVAARLEALTPGARVRGVMVHSPVTAAIYLGSSISRASSTNSSLSRWRPDAGYLLYSICDKKKWTDSALLFNGLVTSWSDLSAAARGGGARTPPPAQRGLDCADEEGD